MSTQLSIEAGNKIIGEFMGYRMFDKRYPKSHGIGAPEAEWNDMIIQKAKYHSSWDWIMPVIEKINATNQFDVIIFRTTCYINDKDQILFETSYETSKKGYFIMDVWEVIVQFTQCYNQQNKL